LKATTLIELSIGIENQMDSRGDLVPLPGKDSTLFSVGRHETGYVRFFRHDVPLDVRRRIEALDPEVALRDHEAVRQILGRCASCDRVFTGRAYYFAHTPSREDFPDAVLRDGRHVVVANGEPVSWAWTADESERAAELAVETASAYRRRGYARQVVSAWANHVLGQGKVAFFSHETGNVASEALARSLGVTWYAVVTTYESKIAAT
jgi:RimJ/RimL family protein N-acetyltransferase